MTELLANAISQAGWLAPFYYLLAFLVAALLPVMPSALVAALGGTALGLGPAVGYGVLGLALGAGAALLLSRRLGKPLLKRLIGPTRWAQWERFVSIRSPLIWAAIFGLLNVDFLVLVAGLSRVPLATLWLTAVLARVPVLVAAAWFGQTLFSSDLVLFIGLALLVPGLILLGRNLTWLRSLLLRWTEEPSERPARPLRQPVTSEIEEWS